MALHLILPLLVAGKFPSLAFMKDHRPMSVSNVYFDGPSRSDETVGKIRLYTFEAQWRPLVDAAKATLIHMPDVDVLPSGRGFLQPFTGADVRFVLGYGAAVGLYRDFKAARQPVPEPFLAPQRLAGGERLGWVTAVVFDGEIREKAKFRIKSGKL